MLPTLDIASRQSMRKKRKLKSGGTGSWVIASGYTCKRSYDDPLWEKYIGPFSRKLLRDKRAKNYFCITSQYDDSKYLKDETLALGDDIFNGNPVVLDVE